MKLITPKDLPAKLGTKALSRTTIWRAEKAGTWPKRIMLSKKKYAWDESEIDKWIEDRAAERNTTSV